jgi:hypothetical protein
LTPTRRARSLTEGPARPPPGSGLRAPGSGLRAPGSGLRLRVSLSPPGPKGGSLLLRGGGALWAPPTTMKKRIHPFLEPKLIIHTNGSTYLNGPAAPFPLRGGGLVGAPPTSPPWPLSGVARYAAEANPEAQAVMRSGEESLLCFLRRSGSKDAEQPSKQDSSRLRAAGKKIQKCLSPSHLIKYLDLPSSGPESGGAAGTKGSQAPAGAAPWRSSRFKKGTEVIKMSEEAATSVTARVGFAAPPRVPTPPFRPGGSLLLRGALCAPRKVCLVLDTDTVPNPL